jgi:hypothetical protein
VALLRSPGEAWCKEYLRHANGLDAGDRVGLAQTVRGRSPIMAFPPASIVRPTLPQEPAFNDSRQESPCCSSLSSFSAPCHKLAWDPDPEWSGSRDRAKIRGMEGRRDVDIHRPDALAVYPEGYRLLFARAALVFHIDPRVRGMWLHGAPARGAADAGSDLDIDIAVVDDEFDDFAASWREWLAEITPTVSVLPVAALPGSFYALTPSCERLDVICERVSQLPTSQLTRRLTVFDKDDLAKLVPPPRDPEPDPNVIGQLIREVLRQAANFPSSSSAMTGC